MMWFPPFAFFICKIIEKIDRHIEFYFKVTPLLEACNGVMLVTSGSNLFAIIFWWLLALPLPPLLLLDFFNTPTPPVIRPATFDISFIFSTFSSKVTSEVDAQISETSCCCATFSFLFCDLVWPCWLVPSLCCLFCFALLLWCVGVVWVLILTTLPTAFVLPCNQ